MNRNTRIQTIAAVVLVGSMLASTGLSVAMSAVAGRARIAATDKVEEGQPWEVSAGIAMGAFRGLFVNILWMRANDLKEAGKFHEAVELASAITRLQPRFPRVWVFHAWNLAYNISVSTKTSTERWDWVNQGIRILRDKGIPANPNDMLLHKELAWIFLHKVQGYTDDANPYYKRRFAAEWTVVLGNPPANRPEYRDRDKAIQAYVDWLTPIAEAPGSIEELVSLNPKVGVLVDRLRKEGGLDRFEMNFLDRWELYSAFKRSSRRSLIGKEGFDKEGYLRPFIPIIEDPAMADAWPPFLAFVRREALEKKYHMEPQRMIRYTQKYGPMDWRHPAAHGVYWGQKGVEAGVARVTDQNKRDFDFINTDRMVAHGVQELFRSGEMYMDFLSLRTGEEFAYYQTVPNPHFVQSYGDILDELVSRSWADNQHDRGFRPYLNGYENFLRDAVLFYYRRGEKAKAEQWMKSTDRKSRFNTVGPNSREDFLLPLEEFVQKELSDRYTSPYIAVAQVTGALSSAYASGLLGGDKDLFLSQFDFAKRVHAFYFTEQSRSNAVNREQNRMDQMDPDFRILSGGFFFQFMLSLDLDDAERAYDAAPEDLRAFAYDALAGRYKPELDELAKQGLTRSFDQIFPMPRGKIDEIRRLLAETAAKRQAPTVDVEQK